jgi:F-type H+-transporting ATPase subunit epsilon
MVVKSNRAVQGHRHRSQREFTRFGTTLRVTYNRLSITGEPHVANAFRCTVITPGQQVLDQDVTYVSIPAWDGEIGVLSGRAPLFVQLGDGLLKYRDPKGEHKFFVTGGFAQVKDNKLSILTDAAIPPSDIKRQQAEEQLTAALATPAKGDEAIERKRRVVSRARGARKAAGA